MNDIYNKAGINCTRLLRCLLDFGVSTEMFQPELWEDEFTVSCAVNNITYMVQVMFVKMRSQNAPSNLSGNPSQGRGSTG